MTGNQTWACKCGWSGDLPSMTDASTEVERDDGTLVIDRTHHALCPRCFEFLSRPADPPEAA